MTWGRWGIVAILLRGVLVAVRALHLRRRGGVSGRGGLVLEALPATSAAAKDTSSQPPKDEQNDDANDDGDGDRDAKVVGVPVVKVRRSRSEGL